MDVDGLFHAHHESLYRYLVRYTGDAELAADAAQEAFVRMIETEPNDHELRAWLFTVATNYARERARTRARQSELAAESADRVAPDRPPEPDEIAHARTAAEGVRRGLRALRPRDRTILLMREEGFTHREIAEAVGTTTRSVGTMIARALDKLATTLNLDEEPAR